MIYLKNMYGDSVKQWNVFVGCYYDCFYCEKSFKAQMKRQKHNCKRCYDYIPHFHPERLNQSLPKTKGDEFIWACSSSDINFAKREWIEAILKRIREMPDRTFLFQSKNPACFKKYDFPDNVILDVTLETNRNWLSWEVSDAPSVSQRYHAFLKVEHLHKIVTVEPALDFDLNTFFNWIRDINPMRVYVGYDSKDCMLSEPSLSKTKKLIRELSKITKVKTKLLREAWDFPKEF